MSLYHKLKNPKMDYFVPPRKGAQNIKLILQEFQKYPIRSQVSLQCFLDKLFLESYNSHIVRIDEGRGHREFVRKFFV